MSVLRYPSARKVGNNLSIASIRLWPPIPNYRFLSGAQHCPAVFSVILHCVTLCVKMGEVETIYFWLGGGSTIFATLPIDLKPITIPVNTKEIASKSQNEVIGNANGNIHVHDHPISLELCYAVAVKFAQQQLKGGFIPRWYGRACCKIVLFQIFVWKHRLQNGENEFRKQEKDPENFQDYQDNIPLGLYSFCDLFG